MTPRWVSRFQLKPGKWVFQPSSDAKDIGRKIKAEVERVWQPPDFYYHLRAGGHVEAVRSHTANTHFLHLDIQDFFGSVNRSRITRCLKSRFPYAIAREWANESTVRHPSDAAKYILPYGFVQSPILASLALADSRLGGVLQTLANSPRVVVSVYVDDIIVSTDDPARLSSYLATIRDAAERSLFPLNASKEEGPAPSITAFNIELAHSSLVIKSERLDELIQAYIDAGSSRCQAGILSYVQSVNPAQLGKFIGS